MTTPDRLATIASLRRELRALYGSTWDRVELAAADASEDGICAGSDADLLRAIRDEFDAREIAKDDDLAELVLLLGGEVQCRACRGEGGRCVCNAPEGICNCPECDECEGMGWTMRASDEQPMTAEGMAAE